MTQRLIIVGASTRAAAQSAVRSGFRAWCIDQFGDQDLRACAEHVEVVDDWPDGILKVVPRLPSGTLVITGAIENAPRILARLRERLPFAGCDVDAMRSVRDPLNLQQILRQAGLSALDVSFKDPLRQSPQTVPVRWLRKPLRSAAGFNIRYHETGGPGLEPASASTNDRAKPPACYYQEFAEGISVSGLFLGSGADCRLIGLTRQLVGMAEAGAGDFRYCGSIGPLSTRDLDPRAFELAARIGQVLVEATGCRGLFGCDFLWNSQAGTLSVCEVNPRFTAAAELFEHAGSARLMRWHLDACQGELPQVVDETDSADSPLLCGKLICFAKEPFPAAALAAVQNQITLADIPVAGSVIPTGHPICTVLAKGVSVSAVQDGLLVDAARLYAVTGQWQSAETSSA